MGYSALRCRFDRGYRVRGYKNIVGFYRYSGTVGLYCNTLWSVFIAFLRSGVYKVAAL